MIIDSSVFWSGWFSGLLVSCLSFQFWNFKLENVLIVCVGLFWLFLFVDGVLIGEFSFAIYIWWNNSATMKLHSLRATMPDLANVQLQMKSLQHNEIQNRYEKNHKCRWMWWDGISRFWENCCDSTNVKSATLNAGYRMRIGYSDLWWYNFVLAAMLDKNNGNIFQFAKK